MKDLACNIEVRKEFEIDRVESGVVILDLSNVNIIFNPKDVRVNDKDLDYYFLKSDFESNSNCSYYDRDTKEYFIKTDIAENDINIIVVSLFICLTSGIERRLPLDFDDVNSYEVIYYQAISSSMGFNQSFENIVYGVLTTSSTSFVLQNQERRFTPMMASDIETERGAVLFFEVIYGEDSNQVTKMFKGLISRVQVDRGFDISIQVDNFLTALNKPLYSNFTYDKSMPDKAGFTNVSGATFRVPRLFGANAPSKISEKFKDAFSSAISLVKNFDFDYDSMYVANQVLPNFLGTNPFNILFQTCYVKDVEDPIEEVVKEITLFGINASSVNKFHLWLSNNDDIKNFLIADCVYGLKASEEIITNQSIGFVEAYLYDDVNDRYGVAVHCDGLFLTDDLKVYLCGINGLFIEDKDAGSFRDVHFTGFLQQCWIDNNILIVSVPFAILPNDFWGAKGRVCYRIKNLRDFSENNHAMIALEILRTEFYDKEINVQSFIDGANSLDLTVSVVNTDAQDDLSLKRDVLKNVLTSAMTFIYMDENQKISYGIIDSNALPVHTFNESDIDKNTLTFSWENQDSFNSAVLTNEGTDVELSIKDVKSFNLSNEEKEIDINYYVDFREQVSDIILAETFEETKFFQDAKRVASILIGRKLKVSFNNLTVEKKVKLGDIIRIEHGALPEIIEVMVTGINSTVKNKNITAIMIKEISDELIIFLNGQDVGA